jgi:hypothetical protein
MTQKGRRHASTETHTADAALGTVPVDGDALNETAGARIALISANKLNDRRGTTAESSPTGKATANSVIGNIVASVIAMGSVINDDNQTGEK